MVRLSNYLAFSSGGFRVLQSDLHFNARDLFYDGLQRRHGMTVLPAFLFSQPLYIDISSGSFLLQVLLSLILGALITLRLYWNTLVSFFGQKLDDEE